MSIIPEDALELIETARDLLLQFHEPPVGQLRAGVHTEIDKWLAKSSAILETDAISIHWAEESLARIRAIVLRWQDDYDPSEFPVSLTEVLRLTKMQCPAPDAKEER